MTSFTKNTQEGWHWFALLSITIIVNVPMLSPKLLFSNDTLQSLTFFHFAYSELLLHNEFPRWLPYLGFGTLFDFNLFAAILPTDYVLMAVGWLCGIRDALLLCKISLILCQGVLVLGLYLLSRKCFTSMLTVWMVCLGGLLTTNWMFCSPWSLTSYYMLPLVLWFVLRFLETSKPAHLWLAGLTEGLSLLGTIPYIAPLHLFIVVVFLVPILCRQPQLMWTFVNWRNFVHPLFFVFCGYFLLIGLWIAGIDVVWMAPSRDSASGNVSLEIFLGQAKGYDRQPLGVMLRMLVKGDLYYAEIANYEGLLPLAALVYALLRRRDTLFLSMAAVCLALFWFSLGGCFSTLTYFCFPLMKKYRFISAAWNFLRIFLLLLAGFGFDQMIRDLRGQGAPAPGAFSIKARWAVVAVLALCGLDHLFNLHAKDAATDFIFQEKTWPILFERQSASITMGAFELDSQALLLIRFLAHAATFALLWLLLLRRQRASAGATSILGLNWARWVGPVLFAVYLADVGFFYSQVMQQAPWCPPGTPVEAAATVHRIIYRPQRYELDFVPFLAVSTLGLTDCPLGQGPALAASSLIAGRLDKLPADAETIMEVIVCPRGGSPEQNPYASAGVLMQADFVVQAVRLDLMMAGVKKMIEARAHWQEPSLDGKRRRESLAEAEIRDFAFRRSLGEFVDKARMVPNHDAICAANEEEALEIFKALPNPDQTIVIEGPAPAVETAETVEVKSAGKVDAAFFSANRVEFDMPPGPGRWLFYADAYYPAWKALVDGQPAKVYRANVGFKAVHVPTDAKRVTFYFDAGGRDVHYLAFVAASTLLACALTAMLFAAPWVCTIGPESASNWTGRTSAVSTDPELELLKTWSALTWLAALAGGLFLGADFFCLAVLIVAGAIFAVFIVHTRTGQTSVR